MVSHGCQSSSPSPPSPPAGPRPRWFQNAWSLCPSITRSVPLNTIVRIGPHLPPGRHLRLDTAGAPGARVFFRGSAQHYAPRPPWGTLRKSMTSTNTRWPSVVVREYPRGPHAGGPGPTVPDTRLHRHRTRPRGWPNQFRGNPKPVPQLGPVGGPADPNSPAAKVGSFHPGSQSAAPPPTAGRNVQAGPIGIRAPSPP